MVFQPQLCFSDAVHPHPGSSNDLTDRKLDFAEVAGASGVRGFAASGGGIHDAPVSVRNSPASRRQSSFVAGLLVSRAPGDHRRACADNVAPFPATTRAKISGLTLSSTPPKATPIARTARGGVFEEVGVGRSRKGDIPNCQHRCRPATPAKSNFLSQMKTGTEENGSGIEFTMSPSFSVVGRVVATFAATPSPQPPAPATGHRQTDILD